MTNIHRLTGLSGFHLKRNKKYEPVRVVLYEDVRERMELQADCLAGVFIHHHLDMFEPLEVGDMNGVCLKIGNDRPGVKKTCAYSHGTGEQRKQWFARGLKEGRVASCDSFSLPRPAL